MVEGDTGEAWAMFTQTQFYNISYPKWTHGEYALASFGADNLHSHDGNDTSLYIRARVPATRVNFNCSLIDHYANGTYLNDPSSGYLTRWLPVDPRPLGCHATPEANLTAGKRDLYLVPDPIVYVNSPQDTSWGSQYYLVPLVDQYARVVCPGDSYCLDNEPPEMADSIRVCGDERQHYFIGLGYEEEALPVLHCVPYVEALWVTANFTLPDLSLVTDVPVVPDRHSAVFLSDSASMTALGMVDWQEVVALMVNGSSGVGKLTGLPSNPDSNNTLHQIAALESTLSGYLAQVLHLSYRRPVPNTYHPSALSAGQNLLSGGGHPINGRVTDLRRLRLIQNTVSTRILEGLLAVMGACLVASTALGRGARVIPRDPGSVASRMAYFAGGEVWRRVPVGADRWTDKQIRKHGLGVSEGRLLLSWWGGDGREASEEGARGKRFAVDVVACKEAA
ncbi:hypothetical protein FJTKL_13649 [Diaporthe vaccinii]|uniref:Uncharacterized protein n=1 Tax=Diaporthe vaccinii TaxID=105482 RepID=A0ABR4E9G4_9PEZI